VSSWAELPAWVVALRAATPQLSWKQAPALASGQGDWPATWHLGEVTLAAGSPPALLLCPVAAPTQLRVALTAAQPPPLWLPAGTSAESLAAALLPYREVAVPSRLQLPLPRRLFVGHTESLGAGFAELVARLAAHPAVEPEGWGSAYPDDPWPRPLPEALPAAARELLGRHYAAQAPDLPRSMTFVSRWSRSLLSLEDHAGPGHRPRPRRTGGGTKPGLIPRRPAARGSAGRRALGAARAPDRFGGRASGVLAAVAAGAAAVAGCGRHGGRRGR
jgi:hypothetical protein